MEALITRLKSIVVTQEWAKVKKLTEGAKVPRDKVRQGVVENQVDVHNYVKTEK